MKRTKNILLLSFLICLTSCKKDSNDIKLDKEKSFYVNINFPDTVYRNSSYNGKINYRNALDTITVSLNDPKKYRFIDFAFLRTDNISYNEDYLKKIVTDTFTSENNRIIPLYNIFFNKLGVNYIDGIITDQVSIEGGGTDKYGKPMTRIITNEFRVNHKVIVINRPEPKSNL
ncbi:hypothetical protein [Flavobacterium sp. N502540]|uniref:hypothetical protein n=1 Tax=Flavobacterium sp. N502540 TaxID=2986838 RepID=UPI002223FFB8|nr:hypothetical protein [Flavobacterium sp. N502540]